MFAIRSIIIGFVLAVPMQAMADCPYTETELEDLYSPDPESYQAPYTPGLTIEEDIEMLQGLGYIAEGEDSIDSDGDGMPDDYEADISGTHVCQADSDSDGLNDMAEYEAGTDPWNDDSDNDNLKDGFEANYSFGWCTLDPLDPYSAYGSDAHTDYEMVTNPFLGWDDYCGQYIN